MRAILSAIAGSTLLAFAAMTTSSHAETTGLYFGADIGLFDFDLPGRLGELQGCDGNDCESVGSPSYDDIGFRLSGVVGTGLTENLRVEAEVFFDIDTASGSRQEGTGLTASVSGDVRTYGGMLNGWFDIGSDEVWGVYVGGGAGMLFAKTSHNIVDRANAAFEGSSSDTDTEFAYQLGGGLHFQGWHVGYRYMKSGELNDYGNLTEHILLVGLRMW